MYRLSGLSLLLLLVCLSTLGSPQAAPPPSATSSVPQNGASAVQLPSPEYAQEPFLIEKYHSTARFENDGTGERELNVRVRVQSDAGVQALGELVFSYGE